MTPFAGTLAGRKHCRGETRLQTARPWSWAHLRPGHEELASASRLAQTPCSPPRQPSTTCNEGSQRPRTCSERWNHLRFSVLFLAAVAVVRCIVECQRRWRRSVQRCSLLCSPPSSRAWAEARALSALERQWRHLRRSFWEAARCSVACRRATRPAAPLSSSGCLAQTWMASERLPLMHKVLHRQIWRRLASQHGC